MKEREKVSHYEGAIEPVEFILANSLPFCEGNVIKYVCRHEKKGGKADLLKAIDYINLIIKDRYPDKEEKIFCGLDRTFYI